MTASLPGAALLGLTLFAATNIDDIFILLGFFSDPSYRARNVILGQFIGISFLVLVSIVAALVALVIPEAYIGFLGLAPIGLGLKKLLELRKGSDDGQEGDSHPAKGSALGQIASCGAVTVANGGDNIGVYVPVFAVRSRLETAIIVLMFVVLTALWCVIAHWLVHHRTLGDPIRRYGQRLMPLVLIGIGLLILQEAGSFALVYLWFAGRP